MATAPNRMTPIEHYRQCGLEPPIRFRARLTFHLLLWLGCPFLIIACIAAIARGEFAMQLVGAFGLCFFGMGALILLLAITRSWTRGLCELSTSGLYLAHIGYTLPWTDLGPAWVLTSTVQGHTSKCVHFVVKNASGHSSRMGLIGQLLFAFSRWQSRSRPGGLIDWGTQALSSTVAAATDDDTHADEFRGSMSSALQQMRDAVAATPDSAVFNIPLPLHFGISAEDLAGLMNQHILMTQRLRQAPSDLPPLPIRPTHASTTTPTATTPPLQSSDALMTTLASKDALKRHHEQIMRSGADDIRARQSLGELTPEAAEAEYKALRQRVTADYRRAKAQL